MRIARNAIRFILLASLPAALTFAQGQNSNTPSGLDLGAIDKSVDPCSDFYAYACGAWMKSNPIPPDQSSWGRFDQLHNRNQEILRAILEDAERNQSRSDTDQKIGAFYHSCMDERAIDNRGAEPLKPELDRLNNLRNIDELPAEVARLHSMQVDVFFEFDSTPDPKNARMVIADLDQGGLGLPERDFYFRDDERSKVIRQKYVAHVANMFELIGIPSDAAKQRAQEVMGFETQLAKASLDVTSRRDPQLLVHEYQKSGLAALAPHFNFVQFFSDLDTPGFSKLNVGVPAFLKAVNTQLTEATLPVIKEYMTWHYLNASATLLPKPFVDENFDFYAKTLSGVAQIKPRWRRCVAATDSELGEALGKAFVEKTFGEEGKQRTLQMVHEIEAEMQKDIEAITWMSPDTKKQALVKLHAVTNKIGFPEKWRDYSSVKIVPDDYFGNSYRCNEFESKRERDKIGKPVDRGEWVMTPPTVNAYYEPTENNINFPAGILQPPFYSNQATDAVNYGAVGVVIGHELTHGFDDAGRQFDADGNLKDWWQKSDEEQFNKLADCFVNEYGGFSPVPGIELNGRLTLGENTADNGGIRLAYLALMDDLAKKTIPVMQENDGYSQAQQFFLGFAQVWCTNERPEEARLRAQTDPHSPGKFRVNGVVSNLPEFSEAFGCKAGQKIYTAHGCRVW